VGSTEKVPEAFESLLEVQYSKGKGLVKAYAGGDVRKLLMRAFSCL